MSFIKRASSNIALSDIISSESMESDPEINARFKKFAEELKSIAPKAKDFLYFSAIMMHSAEASIIDSDGAIKFASNGDQVKCGWESNGDSIKWWCTDDSIKPYKNSNCFIAGTKILMFDGTVKNIEDVELGDKVVTHKNRTKKVTEVFSNKYSGDLVKLQASHNPPIYCTPEHPVFIGKNNTTDSNTKRVLSNNKLDYRFVNASEVSSDDHVLGPVLNTVIESDITEGQARLFGLYAAEGSLSKKGIALSFSHLEYDNLALEACNLFKKEFPDHTVNLAKPTPSQPTKCTLYVAKVGELFEKHVGKYSHDKVLSKELVFAQPEIKSNFILGWLEGDGHVDKKSGQVVGTTVSENLASQIRVMLNSLGINNTRQIQKSFSSEIMDFNGRVRTVEGKYDVHRIKIPHNEANQLITKSAKLNNFEQNVENKKINVFNNKYSHHSIIEKTSAPYEGMVYNFEVEDDHSYIANDLIVHNCDIFPEKELIAAHKKWVGRPLCLDHKSSSVDAIRGVVVDTYYDHKMKRVMALCALDKINYPDLARKVASGYATSVSMGTAVGKAICSDCGKVAKIEADFCDHMRHKSCYGEINIDLSPIELSIVVNGADPNAKIRTIVASAKDAIDKYAGLKEKISNGDVDVQELSEIRIALEEVTKRLEDLETAAESAKEEVLDNNSAYGMTNSSQHMAESEQASQLPNIQTPGEARLSVGSLEQTIDNIHAKLGEIKTDLKNISLPKESKMADTRVEKEAYFQGAGGVNEPAPGKPKYEKENYQSIRDNEDKQMVGQMDTGPVDGMHPGPDSVSMSELERKKMLARAKADERALRRKEALAKVSERLEKESYHQGGGEDNDPSKLPYAKEDYKNNRDKNDKQMTGQAPFPGVGSIDGLHPSPGSADQKDELARKKMLQRASLKAKFIKAMGSNGADSPGDSRWDVYAGNKLILTATVNDISGGRVNALYDTIATKQFGSSLLDKIKSAGVDEVAGMFKAAQAPAAVDAAPGGAPEAPGAAPMPEAMPEAMPEEMPEPVGDETGDPSDTAMKLAEEIRDRASDLVEMLRASEGEAADMESVEEMAPEEGAAPTVASLQVMRKKLNSALLEGTKQALAELKNHHEEMRLVAHIFSDPTKITKDNKDFVSTLKSDAFADAKNTLAETSKLMSSFVKYAQGTEALEKRAAQEAKLVKEAQDVVFPEETIHSIPKVPAKQDPAKEPFKDLFDFAQPAKADDSDIEEDLDLEDQGMALDLESIVEGVVNKELGGMAADDDVITDSGCADDSEAAELSTKEARAMQRAKIAQKGLKFMDLLNEAHPGGGVTTELDVKPTGDLGKVETLEESHRKHMEVASAPPKVRKMAEEIQRLVTAGELASEDVGQLVSLGVDKEAVAYWQKLYGQAPDGGKEFASELTKEKYAAAVETDKQQYRVKLARAYELATEMQVRGMIDNSKPAFNQIVDEIMGWSDGAFNSIKRVVAQQEFKKEASVRVPEVGWIGSGEVTSQNAGSEEPVGLQAQLEAAMSGRKY